MKLFDRSVKGFDTVIGAKTSLVGGVVNINGVAVIDGSISESSLSVEEATVTKNGFINVKQLTATLKLTIEGKVEAQDLSAASIVVKSGAVLKADVISYSQISIENGGLVEGVLKLATPVTT
jgi:cytoskeletal protein CcmA (bactofilin family)